MIEMRKKSLSQAFDVRHSYWWSSHYVPFRCWNAIPFHSFDLISFKENVEKLQWFNYFLIELLNE